MDDQPIATKFKEEPMYSANQIADWFLSRVNIESGDTVSHLKLQKLVYYSQAWHYTLFNQPLFEEKIEAWMHGPVIRSVYNRFQDIPIYNPIMRDAIIDVPYPTSETTDLLEDINQIYGEHTAKYLEDLTHQEDPWIIARQGLPSYAYCENEITLSSMKEFYTKKLGDNIDAYPN